MIGIKGLGYFPAFVLSFPGKKHLALSSKGIFLAFGNPQYSPYTWLGI
jgi:hypothetical protein